MIYSSYQLETWYFHTFMRCHASAVLEINRPLADHLTVTSIQAGKYDRNGHFLSTAIQKCNIIATVINISTNEKDSFNNLRVLNYEQKALFCTQQCTQRMTEFIKNKKETRQRSTFPDSYLYLWEVPKCHMHSGL